jgi:hypothetical protein
MFELFIFGLGASFGLYAYTLGWRAQNPFYKESE